MSKLSAEELDKVALRHAAAYHTMLLATSGWDEDADDNNLARLLYAKGELDKAEELLRKARRQQ